MPSPVPPTDNLLLPLLHAEAEEAKHLVEQLVAAHASPVIQQIIKSKLCLYIGQGWRQEAEDLQNEVLVKLLTRLRAFKADPAQQAISNFRGYVAVTTYHACYEHLRRKYPQYQQLKNRLRYLLTHRSEFDLWEGGPSVWLGGFIHWRAVQTANPASERLQELRERSQTFTHTALGGRPAEQLNLAELLAKVFDWVGHPIELDQLVNLIACLRGQTTQPSLIESEQEYDSDPLEALLDPRANPAVVVEARQQLQHLWNQVKQLPLAQRTALLLNLRDENGGNATALLPHTGTATLRQIADALALSAIELAELWPRLPLDDDAIALRLGLARQQVINLRLAARRRLTRRMRTYGEPAPTA